VGRRPAAAALLVLAATVANAGGPPLRVLASSGMVVGDLPVARFMRPIAIAPGRVVFRGLGTVLHVSVDGVERTLLRTGDPLPAPLEGTLNEIVDVATSPSGRVAVVADANSVEAAELILIGDGAPPVPVVVNSAATDPGIVGVAINAGDDIVYWTGAALFVRLHGSATSETIGAVGGKGRLRLRPLIAAGPEATWMTEGARGGLWYWSPGAGTMTIAETGVAGPLGSSVRFRRSGKLRLGLALHPTAGVAFTARAGSADGAFLWSPSTRTVSLVAKLGGSVGDAAIRRFRGEIQFADDGAVLFRAELRRRTTRPRKLNAWVRAKDGVLALADSPVAPPVMGAVHRLERRSALFALEKGVVTPLLKPGNVLEGSSTIASVESHAARGNAFVAAVSLDDGGVVVVLGRKGRLERVPVDDENAAAPTTLAVGGRTVASLTDGTVYGGRERLRLLRPPHRKRFEDFYPDGVAIGGRRIAVFGSTSRCDLVMLAHGRHLAPIAAAGEGTACRRGLPVSSFDALAAGADELFVIGTEGADRHGLYRLRRRTAARIATRARSADGSLVDLDPLDVLVAGGRPVVLARTPEDASLRQLFLVTASPAVGLVREGDGIPEGTVRFDGEEPPVSGDADQVVLAVRLQGGGVRRVIVAQALP